MIHFGLNKQPFPVPQFLHWYDNVFHAFSLLLPAYTIYMHMDQMAGSLAEIIVDLLGICSFKKKATLSLITKVIMAMKVHPPDEEGVILEVICLGLANYCF